MRKLIGVSFATLFAMAAGYTADAQVYDTIIKNKRDGTQKVKVVQRPPVILMHTAPGVIEMYNDASFYGYRRQKYLDSQGRKVIIYDNPYPYDYPYRSYYYRYW